MSKSTAVLPVFEFVDVVPLQELPGFLRHIKTAVVGPERRSAIIEVVALDADEADLGQLAALAGPWIHLGEVEGILTFARVGLAQGLEN